MEVPGNVTDAMNKRKRVRDDVDITDNVLGVWFYRAFGFI
jgi:hypothetical protein